MELPLLGEISPGVKITVINTPVIVGLLAIRFVITLQIHHNNSDVTWNSEALLYIFPPILPFSLQEFDPFLLV